MTAPPSGQGRQTERPLLVKTVDNLALGLAWMACAATFCIVLLLTMRSEEHTSELQSLMRISYAVFCLKKKKTKQHCIYTSTIVCDVQHTRKHTTYLQNAPNTH